MSDSLESGTVKTIDSLLRDRMREDGIPGLSLAVVDDETVFSRGYGSRDLASDGVTVAGY